MKKQIGQRENFDQDLDEALQVLRLFTLGGPLAKTIRFDTCCNRCRAKIVISLSEDTATGQIYLEGPEKCPDCENPIFDPKSELQMSQEEIFHFFGKY